jgi:hypothetical protein
MMTPAQVSQAAFAVYFITAHVVLLLLEDDLESACSGGFKSNARAAVLPQ